MIGYKTSTQVVAASGAQTPIAVLSPVNIVSRTGGYLQPGIIVLVSSGASLQYNIEVSGDDVLASGYVASTGVWVPFTGMSALTATAIGTLGAAVQAVRLNVTTYASGTITFQFIQMTSKGS